jgi:hypothetical protein
MTPKQKANELFFKYYEIIEHTLSIEYVLIAKKCAIIAVDEILETEPRYPSDVDWDDVGGTYHYYYEAQRQDAQNYWIEVKKEIENL